MNQQDYNVILGEINRRENRYRCFKEAGLKQEALDELRDLDYNWFEGIDLEDVER